MVKTYRRCTAEDAREGHLGASSIVVELPVQSAQESLVDTNGREPLDPAIQTVIEEGHQLILECTGLESANEQVQEEQILTVQVAELLLGVFDGGGDGSIDVESGVGPFDEALERLGMLVGEVHGAGRHYVLSVALLSRPTCT